jgi:hypothetical protein
MGNIGYREGGTREMIAGGRGGKGGEGGGGKGAMIPPHQGVIPSFLHTVPFCTATRSRIHERTISWRFLGILLRVLGLEVSVWIS